MTTNANPCAESCAATADVGTGRTRKLLSHATDATNHGAAIMRHAADIRTGCPNRTASSTGSREGKDRLAELFPVQAKQERHTNEHRKRQPSSAERAHANGGDAEQGDKVNKVI